MEAPTERENLERFGALVLSHRELHSQLRAAATPESFAALAVKLGAAHGCVFSAAAVVAALGEKRRAWLERWL